MAYISKIKLPNEAESRVIQDTEARNIASSKAADAVFVPADPTATPPIEPLRGLVPAPPAVPGTTKYLREDGTWAEPAGVTDYTDLNNKPQINSVTLTGNLSAADLSLQKEITVDVEGTPTTIADANNSTEFLAGSNVTITGDTTNGTITIAAYSQTHTYQAGTGIDIDNGVISNTGVTSVTASDPTTGTNGTISVTTGENTAVEVAVKGLAAAAYKSVDTTIDASDPSDNLPTSAAVDTYVQSAIAGITGPMIFKGGVTIGADGSITVPQAVTAVKQGYTFKVTTLTTGYAGTIKVGDTLIADKDNPVVTSAWVEDTDWTVVPSGDEEGKTYPCFTYIEETEEGETVKYIGIDYGD